MTNWFKRMTPEEASKFRISGAKFMVIPFTAIIITGMAAVFSPQVQNFLGLSNPTFFKQPNTYTILEKATIGVPYKYSFADELIPLLGPKDIPPIYNFYLGTMNGFAPMGLVLWPDGTLKGTPTGKSSEFEVCVKNSSGRSACKKYRLDIQPKTKTIQTINNTQPTLASHSETNLSLPVCRVFRCGSSSYSPSFDYCCPNEGDPLKGYPNDIWEAGANGPGSAAGKTDSSGYMYWLLSDGKYHLQVYCPCK